MMKNAPCDKMIIAILQNDDYRIVVDDLNEHGFYVTVLNSSGGFLKKPNATIMIGLNHERLDEAKELLSHYGKRTESTLQMETPMESTIPPLVISPVAIPVQCGGVVLFVLDVAQFERF